MMHIMIWGLYFLNPTLNSCFEELRVYLILTLSQKKKKRKKLYGHWIFYN